MTTQPAAVPKNAFLILNGADIVPLSKAIVNIGRMNDNDIVIPDEHISRYHAQLRAVEGKYVLVDLKSTSGTAVNGRKIVQKVLSPGDVITLAGVPVIYGQSSGPNKFGSAPRRPKDAQSGISTEIPTGAVDLSHVDHLLDIFDPPESDSGSGN